MKKRTSKLVMRKETVRALSGQTLSRVIGGQETDAVPYSAPKACGSGHIVALDIPRDDG
jgi:hypothetical protein